MRFKLLKGMANFKGLTLIEIVLNQIALAKEIFILNVAQGYEILVPPELSQKNLSQSYRFYDPILNIIQEDFDKESRQFFTL